MRSTFDKIRRSLVRDRELPLGTRLAKGGRFIAASALARLYLRDCTNLGARPRTLGRPRIHNRGDLTIGDDLVLNSNWVPAELDVGPDARLVLGDGVEINFGTLIEARAQVTIGSRVSIGPYCIIADHQQRGPSDVAALPIEIGSDVWLAGRVTLLPGAKIGEGAVIVAGSVVSGSIAARVVAGGNPARPLRAIGGKDPTDQEVGAEGLRAPGLPLPAAALRVREVLRGVVFADFTVGDLAAHFALPEEGLVLEVAATPYGQVVPLLLAPPPEGSRDFAVVWTRPDQVASAFRRLLDQKEVGAAELEADVDAFLGHLIEAARSYRYVLAPTWTLPSWRRGLGSLESTPSRGAAWGLNVMNARLMTGLATVSNAVVLDAQRWLARAGPAGTSPRGWYLGKVLFQGEVLAEAAREVKAALRGRLGQARKLVVVDLDDTLWGGVVGDLGWEHLNLGGHDAEGEALVDFQRGLKALTERGVVLAIVSKNDEAVALEAIARHPEMVLRASDFVGWRINWSDKAQNVVELAHELNLSLESVVFLDDNPVERARVREMLPEVLVPAWPSDKLLYPAALDALACFDRPSVTVEDSQRTQMYNRDRQRDADRSRVGNLDAWLDGLDIRVRTELLEPANLTRVVQLLNKTNQMNLTGRRWTEAELVSWAEGPDRALWAFHVRDRFGEEGLTGIVAVERDGSVARIVDFVLSCRVFGRRVEQAMVVTAVDWARARSLPRVEARYRPTAKNKPTLDFLVASSLVEVEKGLFGWNTSERYPSPGCIQVQAEVRA